MDHLGFWDWMNHRFQVFRKASQLGGPTAREHMCNAADHDHPALPWRPKKNVTCGSCNLHHWIIIQFALLQKKG